MCKGLSQHVGRSFSRSRWPANFAAYFPRSSPPAFYIKLTAPEVLQPSTVIGPVTYFRTYWSPCMGKRQGSAMADSSEEKKVDSNLHLRCFHSTVMDLNSEAQSGQCLALLDPCLHPVSFDFELLLPESNAFPLSKRFVLNPGNSKERNDYFSPSFFCFFVSYSHISLKKPE